MTLVLSQTATAIGLNIRASFYAQGGTPPYVYSLQGSGPGGSIDPNTGVYTAPAALAGNAQLTETVVVTDQNAATATAKLFVGSPLLLFCDILQKELGLADGRVYLWDQKIMQPNDNDIYIAVSVPRLKPFGNVNRISAANGVDFTSDQYLAVLALIDIDIISRGPAARDRKEEVVLALASEYAQRQQEANGFFIGRLPPASSFLNISEVDGAAIPYRYRISVNMQYCYTKSKPAPYFNTFYDVDVTAEEGEAEPLNIVSGGLFNEPIENLIDADGAEEVLDGGGVSGSVVSDGD